MSTTCGFFNSLNKDRMYNATHFGHCFDGIIRDGILSAIGDCFVVKAAGGMTITVGSGKSWYLASWLENDADLPMVHEESDVVLSRIDTVVMEFDSSETVRWNDIKIIKGVASSAPKRAVLENSKTKIQIPLALVNINANVSEITQADITSLIGSDECPFSTGVMQTVSLNKLLGQWEDELDQFVEDEKAEFEEWFNEIKNTLDEDAAGNLKNQIDDSKTKLIPQTLVAANWSSDVAPYTQAIIISELTDEKNAKAYPVWPSALADKLELSDETAKVRACSRSGNTLFFECWEEIPILDIPIIVEVYA